MNGCQLTANTRPNNEQADAFIAATCLNEGFDAVLSADSDFLALDCPWIPLRVSQE